MRGKLLLRLFFKTLCDPETYVPQFRCLGSNHLIYYEQVREIYARCPALAELKPMCQEWRSIVLDASLTELDLAKRLNRYPGRLPTDSATKRQLDDRHLGVLAIRPHEMERLYRRVRDNPAPLKADDVLKVIQALSSPSQRSVQRRFYGHIPN